MRPVSLKHEAQIQNFLQKEYSLSKDYLPSSICGSCRNKLSRYEKVSILSLT